MNRIRIENLSKSFSESYVLKNFSLEIASGAAQAVTGPNGSGKSTLLKCIAGLVRPDSGRIIVGESDIGKASEYAACKRSCGLGFLGRSNGLYRDFSILENLEFAARLSSRVSDTATPKEILEELDLLAFASKKISECSQGIARRTGLARLLVIRPRVLILDEPLANIDTEACDSAIHALQRLRDEGCTMVIATHNTHLHERFCTEHIRLSNRNSAERSTSRRVSGTDTIEAR